MSSLEDLGFSSMIGKGPTSSVAVGVGLVLGLGVMGVLMKNVPTMTLTHTRERPHYGLRPRRAEVLSSGKDGLVVRFDDGEVVHISYDRGFDRVMWSGKVNGIRPAHLSGLDPRKLHNRHIGAMVVLPRFEEVATSYESVGAINERGDRGFKGRIMTGRGMSENARFTREEADDDAALAYAEYVEDQIRAQQQKRG